MLVKRDKIVGGPRHGGKLEPLTVSWKEVVLPQGPVAGLLFVIGAEESVHADAASAGAMAGGPLRGAGVNVGRALVHTQILGQIGSQDAVLDIDWIEVSPLVGCGPVHDVVDPVNKSLG